MPNWATDDGRFHWQPPGKHWFDSIEIPHAPVSSPVVKCKCECCVYTRLKDSACTREAQFKSRKAKAVRFVERRKGDMGLFLRALKNGHQPERAALMAIYGEKL